MIGQSTLLASAFVVPLASLRTRPMIAVNEFAIMYSDGVPLPPGILTRSIASMTLESAFF